MLTEDYVMRMITQAIAALLMIVRLKQAGQYEQAQQSIDQALEQLLGLRADLAKQLDDETLLQTLTQNERLDVERLSVVADLFREQGDILSAQGRGLEGQASYRRALTAYLEAGLAEGSAIPAGLAPKIDGLVEDLGWAALPDDTLWALFLYEERQGEYRRAEQALEALGRRPGVQEDLHPEWIGFYRRLLEKSDEDLRRAGFNRDQIAERLGQASDGLG